MHYSSVLRLQYGFVFFMMMFYSFLQVASILNILDDELVQNVGNYILRLLKACSA